MPGNPWTSQWLRHQLELQDYSRSTPGQPRPGCKLQVSSVGIYTGYVQNTPDIYLYYIIIFLNWLFYDMIPVKLNLVFGWCISICLPSQRQQQCPILMAGGQGGECICTTCALSLEHATYSSNRGLQWCGWMQVLLLLSICEHLGFLGQILPFQAKCAHLVPTLSR